MSVYGLGERERVCVLLGSVRRRRVAVCMFGGRARATAKAARVFKLWRSGMVPPCKGLVSARGKRATWPEKIKGAVLARLSSAMLSG